MQKIRFLWNNLYDLAASTKASLTENTNFPLTNIVNPWHTRRWRSTSDVDQWITIDLGSPQTIKALVIKNHNFTATPDALKIQATNQVTNGDSPDWGALGLNDDLTWKTDRISEFWPDGETFRWWRLWMDDPDNPLEYLAIGRIFLGSYFSPLYNFTKRFSLRLVDPSIKKYSSGGQISVEQRTHYRTWGYEFQWVKSSVAYPDRNTFESIFDHVGQSRPYFIMQDADKDWATLYYVQNLSDWEIRHTFGEDLYSLNIAVEEMR